MATIFSNGNGQVVKATDQAGTYYYLADGLGTPTEGAWSREEDAVAALEESEAGWPEPEFSIDERGNRIAD